jgi:hypothetical protein
MVIDLVGRGVICGGFGGGFGGRGWRELSGKIDRER